LNYNLYKNIIYISTIIKLINMLYYKCPTCRTVLANKQIMFEEELKRITNNSKLSDQQKDDEKAKLLDKLQLTRYCCRMRMLTYIDPSEIVK